MMYKHQSVMAVPFAGLTHPSPIGADVGVGIIERMPTFAMGLPCFMGDNSVAIVDILAMREGSEMASTDTVLNFAEVADLYSLRGFPISEAMSIAQANAIPEMPIALRVKGTNPEPAVSEFGMQRRERPAFLNVPPEPLFGRRSDVSAGHLSPPAPLYNIGSSDET